MRGLAPATVVVNVQGDEPLLPPSLIEQVATNLSRREDFAIATLCEEIEREEENLQSRRGQGGLRRKGPRRVLLARPDPVLPRAFRCPRRCFAGFCGALPALPAHRPVRLPRGLPASVQHSRAGSKRARGVARAAARHPPRLRDSCRDRPRAPGSRGGHAGRSRTGEGNLRAAGRPTAERAGGAQV